MPIKKLIEKIKNMFKREDIKRLPAEIEKQDEIYKEDVQKSKFRELMRKGVDIPKSVNMEENYISIVEEYKKTIEKEEAIMDKISLLANGIEFSEEDDLAELQKDKKEEFISKRAKELQEKNRKISSEKAAKYFASLDWDENIKKYVKSAIAVYTESKKAKLQGKEILLREKEEVKNKIIEEIIEIESKNSELEGEILGIQYTGYKHGLTNEENIEKVENIESSIEVSRKIAEVFGYESGIKAIESDKTTDLDRILFTSDRVSERLSAYFNDKVYHTFTSTKEKCEGYVRNGGQMPNLELFDEPIKVSKCLAMSKREEKEYIEKYDELKSKGLIKEERADQLADKSIEDK